MSASTRRLLTAPAIVVGAIIVGQLVGAVFGDGGSGPPVPWAVQIGLAATFGSLSALVAVGLILIYRASRIINFAQTAFGAVTGMFYLLFMTRWGWSFWLALPASLVIAGLSGFVVEVFIVRRF